MDQQSGQAAVTALADPDLARLVKLLRLLGSDQVGERASAALKVHEFMHARGWGWDELLTQDEALPAVSVTVGDGSSQQLEQLAYAKGYADGQRAAQQQQAMAAAQAQAAMHNQAYAAQQAYQPPYNTGLGGLGQAYNPNTQAYAQTQAPPARTWQDAVREIMALPGWPLMQTHRPKESDFVQSLLARNWTNLTTKQEVWLRDICLRLGVEQW